MQRHALLVAVLVGATVTAAGCSTREMATGAAAGAAGYEYSNKRAMDKLEQQYKSGEITKEEYQKRKKEIEQRSLVY